jgi:hypothetical protein
MDRQRRSGPCPMTSAFTHPRRVTLIDPWESASDHRGVAHQPSREAGNTGSHAWNLSVPSPRRDGQAGQNGAFNPWGVAQLTHDAALVAVSEGHPNNPALVCLGIPQANGNGPIQTRDDLGDLMEKKRKTYRRRSPRPLAQPTFGAPACGVQCQSCRQWFHSTHFWRRSRRTLVTRCADCIAKGRSLETRVGNPTYEEPDRGDL